MINRRIGAMIAALRKEQNLTQEQFAEKLGVSNRSISRWENGKTLPDLALMEDICHLTGITLAQLLTGTRKESPNEGQDAIRSVLELWDREKRKKIRQLNLWFSLGLAALLAAVLWAQAWSRRELWLLTGIGLFFQGLGFYRNSRDPGLTDSEKAILSASGDAAMRHPEELLAFARKSQSVAAPQYAAAFRTICGELAEQEQVRFAMVANEFTVDGAPGFWHAGIAVTQDRVFLCAETAAGRFMTRTVMEVCDRKDVLSVQHTPRSITIKTAKAILTIRDRQLGQLGEQFRRAILAERADMV